MSIYVCIYMLDLPCLSRSTICMIMYKFILNNKSQLYCFGAAATVAYSNIYDTVHIITNTTAKPFVKVWQRFSGILVLIS